MAPSLLGPPLGTPGTPGVATPLLPTSGWGSPTTTPVASSTRWRLAWSRGAVGVTRAPAPSSVAADVYTASVGPRYAVTKAAAATSTAAAAVASVSETASSAATLAAGNATADWPPNATLGELLYANSTDGWAANYSDAYAFSLFPDQAGVNLAVDGASWGNETAGNMTTVARTPTGFLSHSQYWALVLVLVPILTLFGNVMVILAVCRERALQGATNYFIVSLALADLLVAVLVMPFAVYVLVNGTWSLPGFVCDFYIAMDVTCSTSSIFNLVAISIDRYIAVTQPIKYAKHKNNRRVWCTIVVVWLVSAAIGTPIVLGLNNTPDRSPDLCIFYNTDFVIYSSLSSFYIPCMIMIVLYFNIYKALSNRARKAKAARKPNASDCRTDTVLENLAQTRRLAETALGTSSLAAPTSSGLEEERPTNTGSGSQDEDEDDIKENDRSFDIEDCHVIPNDKSTEFILATVVEDSSKAQRRGSGSEKMIGVVVATLTPTPMADPNGNNDSGYVASHVEETTIVSGSAPGSPKMLKAPAPQGKRNGAGAAGAAALRRVLSGSLRKGQPDPPSTSSTKCSTKDSSTKESRFTIYSKHKASRKKRDKSAARKERKATKTLAIVLGVFLVCWVPFFTCNILDATCTKLEMNCQPGVAAFILTTWLGYMNSFVNPVIYTIFNPEFRKAFKKLMSLDS